MLNGAAVALPIKVLPSKNSTLLTLPSASAALAATLIAWPAVKLALAEGVVSATVGAWLGGGVTPQPGLVPLALAPEAMNALAPLSGVAFETEARCGGSRRAPRFTEQALVTHRGLSGPAILQISSYWQAQAYGSGPREPLALDLLPGVDARTWLAERAHSRAALPTLLAEVLPRRLAQGWCALHGWTGRIDEYPAAARQAMAKALNNWLLMPSGTLGYKKAEVTLGGVSTQALSSQTMEAREVPGLFFIGEVVDVTGWLGGYNFQWAWSSGWVAGQYV